MGFVQEKGHEASSQLALERGNFPITKAAFSRSGHSHAELHGNDHRSHGTISIIAGCSSGIEPIFALAFTRNVLTTTAW